MKVKELIEFLNQVDPEIEVLKRYWDGYEISSCPISYPSIEERFKLMKGAYLDNDAGVEAEKDSTWENVVEL